MFCTKGLNSDEYEALLFTRMSSVLCSGDRRSMCCLRRLGFGAAGAAFMHAEAGTASATEPIKVHTATLRNARLVDEKRSESGVATAGWVLRGKGGLAVAV